MRAATPLHPGFGVVENDEESLKDPQIRGLVNCENTNASSAGMC